MIAPERLAALAFGDLGEAEEASLLEHVLGCDTCSRILAQLAALSRDVQALVTAGQTTLTTPPSLLEALQHQGLVTRHYHLHAGETVACTVDARDVYVATTLHTPALCGTVDVVVGTTRLRDVPFDATSNTLTWVSSGDSLRTLPSAHFRVQVLQVEATQERVVTEYTLAHEAFVP